MSQRVTWVDHFQTDTIAFTHHTKMGTLVRSTIMAQEVDRVPTTFIELAGSLEHHRLAQISLISSQEAIQQAKLMN